MTTPPKDRRAISARTFGRHEICILDEGGGHRLLSVHGPRASAPRERPFRRADLSKFLARVSAARRRALLLDYDGTLAPLTSDRAHSVPYPGIRAPSSALARRAAGRRSGSSADGSCPISPASRPSIGSSDLWGSHGLERRTRHGCWVGPAPAAGGVGVPRRRGRGPRAARARRPSRAQALRTRAPLARRRPGAVCAASRTILVRRFGGGAPPRPRALRVRRGTRAPAERVPQGSGVERAFDELGDDAAVAYLGDDRTDEDAFEALRGRGLPVLVAPNPRPRGPSPGSGPPGGPRFPGRLERGLLGRRRHEPGRRLQPAARSRCRAPSTGEWQVEPGSGGLVTALRPVLRNRGGRWIGWSGATEEELPEPRVHLRGLGRQVRLRADRRAAHRRRARRLLRRLLERDRLAPLPRPDSAGQLRSLLLGGLRVGQRAVRRRDRRGRARRTTSSGSTTITSCASPPRSRRAGGPARRPSSSTSRFRPWTSS